MAERKFATGGFVRPVKPLGDWVIQNGGCVIKCGNANDEITAVKDDGGTDSQTRPENGADVAKSDADGVIRWCADRGYALDEADEAWVRDTWGVR